MRIPVALLGLLMWAGSARSAPITWQPPRDVAADTDVATNGRVLRAYTFGADRRPTVNGVAFQPFAAQARDTQSLGGIYDAFYQNPRLSPAYNAMLAGGVQDAGSLATPRAQGLTLRELTPGRRYQIQIWVADNRSWPELRPAFSSAEQTARGADSDVNPPTLAWQGGDAGPTAQYAIGTFIAGSTRQTLTFTPTKAFFNGSDWYSTQINALVLADLSPGEPPPPRPEPPRVARSLDDCNVVWDSPSGDSFGSMPLGNGDVGLNVWVDDRGDVLFYVSKVDAFDADHLLPKLGRVRLHFEPALPTEPFEQTLSLRDATVLVRAGDARLRLWVDATQPLVRVEGSGAVPRRLTVSVEPLRSLAPADRPLPERGTAGVLFTDQTDRLAWCYRNQSSAWADRLHAQNTPEMVARAKDPLLGRTSGCVLKAPGLRRLSPTALRGEPARRFDCTLRAESTQPASVATWLAAADRRATADRPAHEAYWRDFWARSYILVGGCGPGPVNLAPCAFTQFEQGSRAYRDHGTIAAAENAYQISQRYALERFCEAAASRGQVPPPYNGSIFTMDMPAGVLGFNAPKPNPVSPDGRDWAQLSFMWQNTRHPYWSMATRGDYDTLLPGLRFVRDGLDICRDHCRRLLGLEGAFIMEASWWHNVGVFDWASMPGHLRYHQLASIELPAIMCEYYEHTGDRAFLRDILLPCADEFIAYYANRFTQRDAAGKLVMADVGCAETYQSVTNPCTEIGCLRFLLDRLLSFELDGARRARWHALRVALPAVPLRRVRGLDLLAVGDKYAAGREICESPELYSIYPFRGAWLGEPALLATARQSFHVRNISLDGTDDKQAVETGGWQSAPVQAAYLGLAREAARLVSLNFRDQFIHWTDNIDPDAPYPQRPRARFPAFWECKMDGTPDNDHGANSANALQSMLLQSAGERILLLPAWPEDWDVSFRLRAAHGTTVDCVYRGGRVVSLRVEPARRAADVINCASPEARIRTLLDVALADRNHLFGLRPMLDAQPVVGPATQAWLTRYGDCLRNTHAGPWPGCLYRDQTLFQIAFDGRPPTPPALLAGLVSRRLLTRPGDGPATIWRLDYDRPLAPLALAAPSTGSLTGGRRAANDEVDLGGTVTFDRLEVTLDIADHRRGQSQPIALQVRQTDGQWRTVHQARVFGNIYSKRFDPVTARYVRLTSEARAQQFDLFAPGQ
ncbi:MAG: hypothetical protein HZB16_08270 [Armatimonadetes bacterium]|nr:hypothetical protein [Armatimonadota bacterium]